MTTKDRFKFLIGYFSEQMPVAETELHYENPFQLLVAVVLSAQCTDKRVNIITPALFEKFPGPQDLANAQFEDVFPLIRSVSYPNNKTKHLIGLGKKIMEKFGGQIPETVEALQEIPGVGRKTANVIASVIYDQPTMAVDTHVFRVSRRIGLVPQSAKTPLSVELNLYKHLPKEIIPKAHHWLILHGRYVCIARKPKCENCGLISICRYFQKENPAIFSQIKPA
jgi:endonuclease-3